MKLSNPSCSISIPQNVGSPSTFGFYIGGVRCFGLFGVSNVRNSRLHFVSITEASTFRFCTERALRQASECQVSHHPLRTPLFPLLLWTSQAVKVCRVIYRSLYHLSSCRIWVPPSSFGLYVAEVEFFDDAPCESEQERRELVELAQRSVALFERSYPNVRGTPSL